MKKIIVFFLLIILCGCFNNSVSTNQIFANISCYQNVKNKNIEFIGIKNNNNFINKYGYSYFIGNIASIFEKQKLMIDRTGFIIDEINTASLSEYNSNNRYVVFGEIKNYQFYVEQEISPAKNLKSSLKLLASQFNITNYNGQEGLIVTINHNIDINFYVYDTKQRKVIKKIPIAIHDKDTVQGSWQQTSEQDKDTIYSLYFIKIFNKIGQELYYEFDENL